MRVFVAIELPGSLRTWLVDAQRAIADALAPAEVRAAVRWTPVENIHLTLRFLGEATEEQRGRLTDGLASIAAAHARFDLALAGVGCFPNYRRPSVVWSGIAGQLDLLNALQRPIETLARSAGFVAEERPFSPHLTLARVRRDASPATLAKVGDALKTLSRDPATARWSSPLPARTIALIHSDLRPTGPLYTPLARYDLAD